MIGCEVCREQCTVNSQFCLLLINVSFACNYVNHYYTKVKVTKEYNCIFNIYILAGCTAREILSVTGATTAA